MRELLALVDGLVNHPQHERQLLEQHADRRDADDVGDVPSRARVRPPLPALADERRAVSEQLAQLLQHAHLRDRDPRHNGHVAHPR